MSQRIKRIHRATAPVLNSRLLADGERIVVGVSGGADSLCLLHLLLDRSRRHRANWDITAVHIDPGFGWWNPERVNRICHRLGVACRVIRLQPHPGLSGDSPDCFWCSRARRRALFEATSEFGATKLALGHHLEDINETFLINLAYASSGATMLPEQPLFGGAICILRPLYRITEDDIRYYLRHFGIRAVRNRCPNATTGARTMIRRFLKRLYRSDPRTRSNIFTGIHNLKPHYLPSADTTAAENLSDTASGRPRRHKN